MEKILKLGNKIRSKREGNNWSLEELSEKLSGIGIDINPSSLFRIEKGQRQKIDTTLLLGLNKIFNFNFISILDNDYQIKVGNIDLNNPITEFKQIPIYDSISAGFGSRESGIIGRMPLPQTNGFRGDVIGIRVDGDSMQPDIKDGDTVLIKKEIMPENGEVGAFILNNEGLLKRYQKTDRGGVILSSDNKDYDPIIINESDEFHIVGKKVGVFNH
ncbi:S24 family peptidase [Psychrilyobacter sp.]|uniref:helix-turn-helix domain-containing protein n=1 Tax=Psychrilyobacter sp. TaxID=2586924 RepID=UPI00301A3573